MSVPRVFHCDDSTAFRVLVREMLHDLGDVDVVGEAGTLPDALAALPDAGADVVLVDLLDHERGQELLGLLGAAAPGVRLLLYTGMPADRVPEGADGHVHKSVSFEELNRAIVDAARR